MGKIDTYETFSGERYFPALDGLRALSILLVLTVHSHVEALQLLKGNNGVTIFFVISGFLITTLLLREEGRRGTADLAGFYIRRAFRLLPLYLVALLIFTAAVMAGLGENPGNYPQRLVLFLTLGNEFAAPGTFGHSWSLSIEEKFYILWPLLAFALPVARRTRLWIAVGLLLVASVVGFVWGDTAYVGIYAPILAGCLLAVITNRPRGYAIAARLAHPWIGAALLIACIAAILISPDGKTQVLVGLLTALAFPFLLFRDGWARRLLSVGWIVWAGRRAYAVYLFHPLVGSAISAVLPQDNVPMQVVHLVAMTLLSFALAEVLHRNVEAPLISVGRRFSQTRLERASR